MFYLPRRECWDRWLDMHSTRAKNAQDRRGTARKEASQELAELTVVLLKLFTQFKGYKFCRRNSSFLNATRKISTGQNILP